MLGKNVQLSVLAMHTKTKSIRIPHFGIFCLHLQTPSKIFCVGEQQIVLPPSLIGKKSVRKLGGDEKFILSLLQCTYWQ